MNDFIAQLKCILQLTYYFLGDILNMTIVMEFMQNNCKLITTQSSNGV